MACNGNCNGGRRGKGRRHRENRGAYQAGWALGILCIILIIIAFAMNGRSNGGSDPAQPQAVPSGDGNGNGNGNGAAMIFGFFFFIIIIIFLFGSSNVYYRYDDENYEDPPGSPTHPQHDHMMKSAANLQSGGFGKTPDMVLLVFGAKWCGYTKKFVSELELVDQLTEAFVDFPVYMKYIECADNERMNCPQVQGYPTSYLIDTKNDVIVKEFAGYMPAADFMKQLAALLKQHKPSANQKQVPNAIKEHYKK